jgi:putative tricarboxylic transport membrane protein
MTGWASGAPAVALGLAAAVLARRLPGQAGFGLGPAFLPFWTGVVLAGCGVWLCFIPGGVGPAERPDARGLGRAAVGLGALLLYALALEPLGYLLGTGSFLVGGGLLLDRRRPGRALAIGIGSAGFLLLVFRVWLRVPLPAGVLGW